MWTERVDNSTVSDQQGTVLRWSPASALVVAAWCATVVAIAWCVALWLTGADAPGRLVAGVTATGLAAWSVWGTRARPRLQADPDGVTVRGFGAAHHHPWPLVQDVRIVHTRRLGRESSLLEIDTTRADGTERLLVFGRLDLAADPEDVAAALMVARPGR